MPVTLLGSDELKKLLTGIGRVTLVNRTAPDDRVTVVAFALVRHLEGGETQRDAAFDLSLGPDEAASVEALPPLDAAPGAIEVLLRLRIGLQDTIVEAYVAAERPDGATEVTFEVGVKRNETELTDGEEEVPEFPEFAVYALASS